MRDRIRAGVTRCRALVADDERVGQAAPTHLGEKAYAQAWLVLDRATVGATISARERDTARAILRRYPECDPGERLALIIALAELRGIPMAVTVLDIWGAAYR